MTLLAYVCYLSSCLVSCHPESSIEEIESYYCPHCLQYFAEAEAGNFSNRSGDDDDDDDDDGD